MSETKYFNLKQCLVDGGILKDVKSKWIGKAIAAIIAKRRIGKTWALEDLIVENWEESNYQNLLLYIRTTDEELKAFARSFNVKYANQYKISGTHIYKIFCDETGKELVNKRIIVGLVGAISTFSKLKSLIVETNFNLVVWDEFNGYDGLQSRDAENYFTKLDRSQYFYLLELIASIEGKSKDLLVLLIGNKVNSQNDILLNWGIKIPQVKNDYDIWTNCDVTYDGTPYKIRFCNGGFEEYKEVNKGNQLFKALATYDKRCADYFNNNDFFQKQDNSVISRLEVPTDIEPKCYFQLGKNTIALYDDGDKYYFDEVYEVDETKDIYPLSFNGFIYSKALVWEEDDAREFADAITDEYKNGNVFFTSNWLKCNFIVWLKEFSSYGLI